MDFFCFQKKLSFQKKLRKFIPPEVETKDYPVDPVNPVKKL